MAGPPSFFLTSADSVFIGVTPGKGPQLKPAGVAGGAGGPDFFSATAFACNLVVPDPRWRRECAMVGEPGDSGSNPGVPHCGVGGTLPGVDCPQGGSPSVKGLCDEGGLGRARGFCGVLKSMAGAALPTAWVFSNGSRRTRSSAPLSFCAALSAFRAAAVVTATFGVTLTGRFACVSLKSAGRRLLLRATSLEGDSFKWDTRCARRSTSSSC